MLTAMIPDPIMLLAYWAWFASLERSEWFDLISTVVGTVALAAAIGIATVEHRRALRVEEQRDLAFRRTVVTLIDALVAKGMEVQAAAPAGNTNASWNEWRELADDVARALEAVLPSAPPSPEAIVAVAAMIRRLEYSARFRDPLWEPASHAGHVRGVATDLAAQLDRLA